MRDYDASHLTDHELGCARRELAASLAVSRPGSPVLMPIQAQLTAIDAELAERATTRLRLEPWAGAPGFTTAWLTVSVSDGGWVAYPAAIASRP